MTPTPTITTTITVAAVPLAISDLGEVVAHASALASTPKIAARTKMKLAMLKQELLRHGRAADETRAALIEEYRARDEKGAPVPVYRYDEATGIVMLRRDENGVPIQQKNSDGTDRFDLAGRPVHDPMIVDSQVAIADPARFSTVLKEHLETTFDVMAPEFTVSELDALADVESVTPDHLVMLFRFIAAPRVAVADLVPAS